MKITACWIVKNEEHNLSKSIESLREAVDELVVVDTGSTDQTISIAEQYGAVVDHFRWVGDFSAARNHALGLASGEVVIFLDADEWFSPALTLQDIEQIKELFDKDSRLESLQLPLRNVSQYDEVESSGSVERILRNTPDLRYVNRIHEQLMHSSGRLTNSLHIHNRWTLHHSGYQQQIFQDKLQRNLELLETALAESSEKDKDWVMQNAYLMRELHSMEQDEKALPYLLNMIQNSSELRRTCSEYQHGFAPFFYGALETAAMIRPRVSRRYLKERLVDTMPLWYPTYPGAPTIQLFYQMLFDLKEDAFLKELRPALEKSSKLPASEYKAYQNANSHLCYTAAKACRRRGDFIGTMEYALQSLQLSPSIHMPSLHLLLLCIRSQPLGESVAFLSSIFDFTNPITLQTLVEASKLEGLEDLHAFFVKKQIDAGFATNATFLYLQLLLGQYENSLGFALQLPEESNMQTIRDHLFLLVVCMQDELLYQEHEELLAPYSNVLDAFFENRQLEAIPITDLPLLHQYGRVALVAGTEAADRLMSVFMMVPKACYMVKSKYLMENERFQDLVDLELEGLAPSGALGILRESQALIHLKRYAEALVRHRELIGNGEYSEELLHQLLVLAEIAPGRIGEEAKSLYASSYTIQNILIDLRDVVLTGIPSAHYTKKQQTELRQLDFPSFQKLLQADASLPVTQDLFSLAEKAASIYEEGKCFPAAMECYRMMLAHNYRTDESRSGLARMFEKLGNLNLARQISKKA